METRQQKRTVISLKRRVWNSINDMSRLMTRVELVEERYWPWPMQQYQLENRCGHEVNSSDGRKKRPEPQVAILHSVGRLRAAASPACSLALFLLLVSLPPRLPACILRVGGGRQHNSKVHTLAFAAWMATAVSQELWSVSSALWRWFHFLSRAFFSFQ